jgi:RNA polymerase sigma-70 factor (ECF subfamily)
MNKSLQLTYAKHSDEDLMRLVRERNGQAFEALYDRYAKRLYNYFLRMLWKDREKAKDFTQDLFAKVADKPDLFDPTKNFATWLYTIAFNMCKNEYAKHEVRSRVHKDIKSGDSFTELPLGGKGMDRSEFMQKHKEALDELDEVKRTTFEMRFDQELTIPEIAEVMQCNEGTVKSRIFYILKDLSVKLKAYEGILVWACSWLMGVMTNN